MPAVSYTHLDVYKRQEQSGAVSGYYGRCDLSFAYAAGDDFQKKDRKSFCPFFFGLCAIRGTGCLLYTS